MPVTDYPAMLFSEQTGWSEIARRHHDRRWFLGHVVMPLSLLPPAMYAYAELMHPGKVFPLSVPAQTPLQLLISGVVFYLAELAMVAYMGMLIQRMVEARDHAPGEDAPYALASIAPIPLWLAALAMAVPSLAFNVAVAVVAMACSIALIRHGVRPILKIDDERLAHYIADVVTLTGIVAWVGLMVTSAMLISLVLGVAFAR